MNAYTKNHQLGLPGGRHFRAELEELGVSLPLRASEDIPGLILDREGRIIASIDRQNEDAGRIALWFALAINTASLFGMTEEAPSICGND
jgi:hypothetical protein